MSRYPMLALTLAAFASGPRIAAAQDATALCGEADRLLRDTVGIVTIVEPDTIDDWRTHKTVAGCRVTAAGATSRADSTEARLLFERIRASGWTRTPDPRDAPNEASLRFRRGEVDCLFNYYTLRSPLATQAELDVSNAVVKRDGERLFNVFVMCMPAGPAGGAPSSRSML